MEQSTVVEPGSSFSFIIAQDHQDIRLDVFVTEKFPGYTRSFFKILVDNGNILINNTAAKKSGIKLRTTDTVIVNFPEKRTPKHYNQKDLDALGVKIVLEHEDFLIIHKPAGLLVHPPSEYSEILSLVDWVIGSYKHIKTVGVAKRPGIVHRLDKDTSGLMDAVLNNQSHTIFSDMFKDRTIKKTYRALVHKHPEKEGFIDVPIGRHRTIRNRMAHVSEGRPSQTNYKVLEYFEEYSLIEIKPVTGRTHQIRVHMTYEGHPLIGDALYGRSSKIIKRHALHAYQLEFEYKGTPFSIIEDVPKDFKYALSRMKRFE
ncbi:RluA family pseudouridine synthase [Candidatus Babeliales bacterium]|nr:RluA family pseudouridine synthase [Candidatus Babeliales bacterium]